MKPILMMLLSCVVVLFSIPTISVETSEVAPAVNYCMADTDGTRLISDTDHSRPNYKCFCEVKCLEDCVDKHCMACLVDENNCQGSEYQYKEINLNADPSPSQCDFMATTSVLAMGDSIMEGAGNNFFGTADMLNGIYGTTIYADTSASGCLLTNYQEPYTSIPNLYTQIWSMETCYDLHDLPDNSFIVMDGGTNDQLWGMSTMPDMTFSYAENTEHDLMWSTRYLVQRLLDDTDHKVPIIYIIPCLSDLTTTEMNVPQMEYLMTLQQEGVYVIDERMVVDVDDFSDSVHINASGYVKVARAISQIVCDHYGYENEYAYLYQAQNIQISDVEVD